MGKFDQARWVRVENAKEYEQKREQQKK